MSYIVKHSALFKEYEFQFKRKVAMFFLICTSIALLALYATTQGSYELSFSQVLSVLAGQLKGSAKIVVLNIRLPRVFSAILCGWGLSLAGLNIQTLLRNPLGSPSTLGISQGAACGAAFAIIMFSAQMSMVTLFAFLGAILATCVILLLAQMKRLTAESIILAGVALSSLFAAATVLLQYIATENELAKVVFWSFGDVARSNWSEIGILAFVVLFTTLKMIWFRWDLNAMLAGEETATSLGVNARKRRVRGMLFSALVAAVATAFHGVLAFVGLIAPHIARRLVGDDHSLLIYFSGAIGALLLLAADTSGRLLMGSGTLPVGVLTSFLGGPMFLYLLLQDEK